MKKNTPKKLRADPEASRAKPPGPRIAYGTELRDILGDLALIDAFYPFLVEATDRRGPKKSPLESGQPLCMSPEMADTPGAPRAPGTFWWLGFERREDALAVARAAAGRGKKVSTARFSMLLDRKTRLAIGINGPGRAMACLGAKDPFVKRILRTPKLLTRWTASPRVMTFSPKKARSR